MNGLNIELIKRLELLEEDNRKLLIPYLNGINKCVSHIDKMKEVKKLEINIKKMIDERSDNYDF